MLMFTSCCIGETYSCSGKVTVDVILFENSFNINCGKYIPSLIKCEFIYPQLAMLFNGIVKSQALDSSINILYIYLATGLVPLILENPFGIIDIYIHELNIFLFTELYEQYISLALSDVRCIKADLRNVFRKISDIFALNLETGEVISIPS